MSKGKKHVTLSGVMLVILLLVGIEVPFSEMRPVVSLPTTLEAIPGGKVVVPIDVAGVDGAGIGSYAIRLDYDDTVLSNPTAVDAGTLSEGNSSLQEFAPPSDGIGLYSVGIGFGFSPSQDGVLIEVQFDVSAGFTGTTSIAFVSKNEKSTLSTVGFEKIEAAFMDGSLEAL